MRSLRNDEGCPAEGSSQDTQERTPLCISSWYSASSSAARALCHRLGVLPETRGGPRRERARRYLRTGIEGSVPSFSALSSPPVSPPISSMSSLSHTVAS